MNKEHAVLLARAIMARAIMTHTDIVAGPRRIKGYCSAHYWIVDVYLPDGSQISLNDDDLIKVLLLLPLFEQGHLRPDDFITENWPLSPRSPNRPEPVPLVDGTGSPIFPEESEESEA